MTNKSAPEFSDMMGARVSAEKTECKGCTELRLCKANRARERKAYARLKQKYVEQGQKLRGAMRSLGTMPKK